MDPHRDRVLFPEVDLEQLLVPWKQRLGVNLGTVSAEVVEELTIRGLDHVPVSTPTPAGSVVLGLISRERLRELAEEGKELKEDDEGICRSPQDEIWARVDLRELLLRMAERSAWSVVYEYDGGEIGSCFAALGLVSRSDLNKHPLRLMVYDIVAKLEVALADLVRCSITDHLAWIRGLKEESQARILGYWELSKLRGVDAGPVVGATLADLLNVVGRDKGLLDQLGYESRSAFEKATGRIPGVRNQAMHPVRPLITDADSCRRLEAVLTEALRLTNRVERVVASRENREPRVRRPRQF